MKEQLIESGKAVAKRLSEVICDPATNVQLLADLAAAYDGTARRLMILGKVLGKIEEEQIQ